MMREILRSAPLWLWLLKLSRLPEKTHVPKPLDQTRFHSFRAHTMAAAHREFPECLCNTRIWCWAAQNCLVDNIGHCNPLDRSRKMLGGKAAAVDHVRQL